jgi:hypothetical protein
MVSNKKIFMGIRQAKNRKRGDEIKKKIFSSVTTEPISTKLC